MTSIGPHRLILTRHAKSSWDDLAMPDIDRPLNERGKVAARELGDFLTSRGLDPEEVLCSPAARTRETWAGVATAVFESLPEVRFVDQLYLATPDVMLDVLRTATQPTVMMIGHNEGIGEFAAQLPAKPPLSPDFRKFPTCATLVVEFQIPDWSHVRPGEGAVMEFFTPSTRGR